MPCAICGRTWTWMHRDHLDHAYTEGEYQTVPMPDEDLCTAGGHRPIAGGAAAPLVAALLPLIIQGIKQLMDLYNTIVNHPETPEALKARYAEVTAQVEAAEAAVADMIRQVRGEE